MLIKRSCQSRTRAGEPCRQAPMREGDFCFWHDPDSVEEASRARQLGGTRRRREGAVGGAYDFEGLETVPQLRRLLQIAAIDALSLENSVARVRAITALVQTASRLMETGELEARIEALEAALEPRLEALNGSSRR
jgi:hypothetical protein